MKVGQQNASMSVEEQYKLQMAKASLKKDSQRRGFCQGSNDYSRQCVR